MHLMYLNSAQHSWYGATMCII